MEPTIETQAGTQKSPAQNLQPTPSLTLRPSPAPKHTDPPAATDTAVHTPTDPPIGLTLYYHDNAMVEMISPGGTWVMIDVYDPALLSKLPGEQDILLTTHHHHDHYQEAFVDSFPGDQLNCQAGELIDDDVHIISIPSSHNAGERFRLEGGTNYIFLIEIGGLRIAHFGDIGQDQLTADQLEVLKPVDVAITQLRNPYSDMGMQNLKGFRLMDQVQPRLVIPTHASLESIQYGLNQWTGYFNEDDSVFIDPSMLSRDTEMLLLGSNAARYRDDFSLEIW